MGATPRVFQVTLKEFAADLAVLSRERFGPAGLVVTYPSGSRTSCRCWTRWPGILMAPCTPTRIRRRRGTWPARWSRAGAHGQADVFNGWPTGVAAVAGPAPRRPLAGHHRPGHTSVGSAAIRRWLVPVAYQDFPPELRPAALR